MMRIVLNGDTIQAGPGHHPDLVAMIFDEQRVKELSHDVILDMGKKEMLLKHGQHSDGKEEARTNRCVQNGEESEDDVVTHDFSMEVIHYDPNNKSESDDNKYSGENFQTAGID